jgi:hypothetical protein
MARPVTARYPRQDAARRLRRTGGQGRAIVRHRTRYQPAGAEDRAAGGLEPVATVFPERDRPRGIRDLGIGFRHLAVGDTCPSRVSLSAEGRGLRCRYRVPSIGGRGPKKRGPMPKTCEMKAHAAQCGPLPICRFTGASVSTVCRTVWRAAGGLVGRDAVSQCGGSR